MHIAQASMTPLSDIQVVQRIRKAALGAGLGGNIALLLFVDTIWRERNATVYEAIELLGLVLILACIFGRTWCTLYIGGRKKGEVVDTGPYSVVRNPLYVFTLLGALGAGLQTGSLVLGLLTAALTGLVFAVVVRQEETFLAAAFPDSYPPYAARVPRFVPKLSLWRDADELVVRPALVRRTFSDALLFLLAIPGTDLIEMAQGAGWLPVIALLP
jgi:protein-S-isoprenylcysteine O-methyltransferase Ste14